MFLQCVCRSTREDVEAKTVWTNVQQSRTDTTVLLNSTLNWSLLTWQNIQKQWFIWLAGTCADMISQKSQFAYWLYIIILLHSKTTDSSHSTLLHPSELSWNMFDLILNITLIILCHLSVFTVTFYACLSCNYLKRLVIILLYPSSRETQYVLASHTYSFRHVFVLQSRVNGFQQSCNKERVYWLV